MSTQSTGKTHTNSIGMVFVEIPAGRVLMPDPHEDDDPRYDHVYARPCYEVHIAQPFFLGKYPVTQEQWEALMENNPSKVKGADLPVENVSWEETLEFIRRLNEREGHERYRLPTEAEWEYACRAGSAAAYCFGDDEAELGDYAWYARNSESNPHPVVLRKGGYEIRLNAENVPHPVGQKRPNAWGLHDMHGGVLERVQPGGYPYYERSAPQVFRGGCRYSGAEGCRCAQRVCYAEEGKPGTEGFRVLLAPEHPMVLEAPEPATPSGKKHVNSLGMSFVEIPAGAFLMGRAAGETWEGPPHRVRITRPFFLAQHPVTRAQWQAVMGGLDSENAVDDAGDWPINGVSWEDAQEFIHRLNRREGRGRYRLPTEAEWEYACRAGVNGEPADLPSEEWSLPNAWGLCDMLNNVMEWCQDWFAGDYFAYSPETDPEGPCMGSHRVSRGGGRAASIANRYSGAPYTRYVGTGFRLAWDEQTRKSNMPDLPEPAAPSGTTHVSGSTGMEFVEIPAGSFLMGDPEGEARGQTQHEARISRPFFLAKYPVTQAQWQAVTGGPPVGEEEANLPKTGVSCGEVHDFIRALNKRDGHGGYRLPTEAEWEYACRAGSAAAFCFGDDEAILDDHAWHLGNADDRVHPVGQKKPNAWGLHDMHGNVLEWVWDWYGDYEPGRSEDPQGPKHGVFRVLRGGWFRSWPRRCRSNERFAAKPAYDTHEPFIGFRLALDKPTTDSRPAGPLGKTHTNSIGMELVLLPAGRFLMGSPPDDEEPSEEYENWYKEEGFEEDPFGEDEDRSDEFPQHEVHITRPFFLGRYPVTQKQWTAVMGDNPSCCPGEDRPVENVSWDEVQEFIRRLNEKEGHQRYRLPTEAEWEYACRAGTTTMFSFGDDDDDIDDYVWHLDIAGMETHVVGRKKPNAWGLHDMNGNVFEWCRDWYGKTYYAESPAEDPQGPETGESRVMRGGSAFRPILPWLPALGFRPAYRNSCKPEGRIEELGFRLLMEADDKMADNKDEAAPQQP